MKKIFLACTMAIINCYALRFQKLFAQTDASIQEIPPATRCTKEAITEYTLNFKPGERFKCSYRNQDWRCVKTTKGYSCDVTENWPTESPKQEEHPEQEGRARPPMPILVPEEPPQPSHVEELVEPPVPAQLPRKTYLEEHTAIELTQDQQMWLQQNFITSRKLNLIFRNGKHM